jgi:hypothetical protein
MKLTLELGNAARGAAPHFGSGFVVIQHGGRFVAIICGIKAPHDGAVAVVEDGRLRFSVETEKLGNGERYSSLGSLQQVTDILAGEGLSPADVSTSLSSTPPARLRIFVLTRLVRP